MSKYITSDGDIFITPASGSSTTITGNVTITGTSTTLSSTDTAIADNIIILNDGESGAGVTLGNAGIEIDRGSLDNVSLRFNDTTDTWQHTVDGLSWGDIPSSITPGIFLSDIVQDLTPELGGDLDVNGKSIITSNTNENIVLDPSGTGIVDVQANLTSTGDITGSSFIGPLTGNADTATTAGTVTTAAQPTITSVGILTALSISGDLTMTGATPSITTDTVADTLTLKADNGITNLTLSGASGSELATFAKDVTITGNLTLSGSSATIGTDTVADSLILQGDAGVTNLTLAGASGSTTAVFTGSIAAASLSVTGDIQGKELGLQGNSLTSLNTNSDIIIDPAGTGVVSITGTSHMIPPIGTTAQRPVSPIGGESRYNTTTGKLEFYNGDTLAWEAAGITITGQIFGDTFTGDGSTSVFVISAASDEENELFVTINGVVQTPITAYTVATTNLTFTSPPANSDVIVVRNLTAAQNVSMINDQDSDTYINVETGSDTDAIEFFTLGTKRGEVDSAGVWTFNDATNVSGASPMIKLTETGVTADNTIWRIAVDTEQLVHQVANDAESAAVNYMTVNRTANVVDSIALNATAITGVTPSYPDNTTNIATTAYVTSALGALSSFSISEDAGGTVTSVTCTDTGSDGQIAFTTDGTLAATINNSGNLIFNGSSATIGTDTIGDTLILQADNGVPNVTFSGAAASELATFHGSVIVTDDLTVNGTTTTINTTNTVVSDALMELGNGTSGTPTNDSGIVVERGTETNMFWGIDGATDEFTVGTGSFTGASTGQLTKTDASVRFGSIRVSTGDILPAGASTIQNIGSASDPWTNGHISQMYGVATSAQYADIAERYETDQEYTVGTVMVFGGDKEVTTSTTLNDHRVAGVISEAPALLMNDKAGPFETHPPIGLTGRVPCRVQGIIKKGDLMITSAIAGVAVAMGDTEFKPGAVLGKALEDYNSDDVGIIEVVLGLN